MISSIAASLGFGSGIDTAALVNDLANASRTPKIQRLEVLAQTNQAKISALAQARSDLDSFSTSLGEVVAEGTLRSQPSVSDGNAMAATANAGVRLGTLSAQIEITQLARTQTVYSDFVPDAADPVGQGNLTLTIGGVTHAIVIDGSNDSLTGLADAINATGSGVKASVVTDGDGSRIVLKGASGAVNAFTLTADAGADPALDRFTFGGAGSLMTLGQSAADANFKVDGVAYSRPTNTVSDVLTGVNLTLKKADPGVLISIGSTRPLETIRQTINDFVSVFNTLKRDIGAARNTTGSDYALRKFDEKISSLIGLSVTSANNIKSLSDIGISTNRDGTISVNSAKLEAALAADPDAVEAIFNPTRDATHNATSDPGISGALKAIKDELTATNGTLEGLSNRLKKEAESIAKNREKTEMREVAYRARLERQYGSMDARIGALKATQSYLEQQIKLWNNSNQ